MDNRTRILTTLSPLTTHQNMPNSFNTGCIVCLKQLTHMVEMVISQTACTKELNIGDTHITPHHSNHQIQHVTNKAFIIEGHPDQVAHFTPLLYVSTPIMSSIPPT